jgi:hypothetical protein
MDPRLCAPAISFLPVGHSVSRDFLNAATRARAHVRSGVKSHERISLKVYFGASNEQSGATERPFSPVLANSCEIRFRGRHIRSSNCPEERVRPVSPRGKLVARARFSLLELSPLRNITLSLAGKWRLRAANAAHK